jgi:hypothetical protein
MRYGSRDIYGRRKGSPQINTDLHSMRFSLNGFIYQVFIDPLISGLRRSVAAWGEGQGVRREGEMGRLCDYER